MKVIIAGGRDFDNYEVVKERCDYFLKNVAIIQIVSGRCDRGKLTYTAPDGTEVYGADGLGEKYAEERGYEVDTYAADWAKYKGLAGPIRNERMAKEADALIAFWDRKSRGTKSMISLANKYKLMTKIVYY